MTDDTISSAIVAALGSMDELRRDKTANVPTKTGGSYSYSYTDIASVLGYVRPILAAHGLVVMQPTTSDGNGTVSVATVLLHKSGESREYPPLTLPAGRTPQEVGSAITYARRYSLLSVLGLATEDDDGKAATQGAKAAAKARPKTAARPALPEHGPATGGASRPRHEVVRGQVMAMFGELGFGKDDRVGRLAKTSGIVGREVGSWSDVTDDEADQVVDALRMELGR